MSPLDAYVGWALIITGLTTPVWLFAGIKISETIRRRRT